MPESHKSEFIVEESDIVNHDVTRSETLSSEASNPAADISKTISLPSSRLIAAAIALLTLVIFSGAISGAFLREDVPRITANPLKGQWNRTTLKNIFTRAEGAAADASIDRSEGARYRPILSVFMMAALEGAGTREMRWHLLVMVLDCVAAIVVFVVFSQSLFGACRLSAKERIMLAVFGAAVFAIHPVQVESVAWVSQIANPLGAVLALSSFLFYLTLRTASETSWLRRWKAAGLIIPALLFALAALTNEATLALILVIALYELFVFRNEGGFARRLQPAAIALVPFVIAGWVYVTLRYVALGTLFTRSRSLNFPDDAALTLFDNIRTIPTLIVGYAGLMIAPFKLSAFYDVGYVRTLAFGRFWLPLSLLILGGGVLVVLARKTVELRVALIGIVSALLPVLINTRAVVSEEIQHNRYLYLPIIGFGLLVGVALMRGARILMPKKEESVFLGAAAVVLVALCLLTMAENRYWRNSSEVWSRASECAPNSRIVHMALGENAEAKQDLDEAMRQYDLALRINPEAVDALNNSAFVYAHQRKWMLAARRFEQVAAITPKKAISHFNLSVAYAALGRNDEEAAQLGAAIQLEAASKQSEGWRLRLAQIKPADNGRKPETAGPN